MDFQFGFNIALAISGFLGGWVLNNLRDSLESLQEADYDLTGKVQDIEVLVAGTYVKRDDLEKMAVALFVKLDKIESKIDQKADK